MVCPSCRERVGYVCRLPQTNPRDALNHAHRPVHKDGRSVWYAIATVIGRLLTKNRGEIFRSPCMHSSGKSSRGQHPDFRRYPNFREAQCGINDKPCSPLNRTSGMKVCRLVIKILRDRLNVWTHDWQFFQVTGQLSETPNPLATMPSHSVGLSLGLEIR